MFKKIISWIKAYFDKGQFKKTIINTPEDLPDNKGYKCYNPNCNNIIKKNNARQEVYYCSKQCRKESRKGKCLKK